LLTPAAAAAGVRPTLDLINSVEQIHSLFSPAISRRIFADLHFCSSSIVGTKMSPPNETAAGPPASPVFFISKSARRAAAASAAVPGGREWQ
jgi:hypothetical protein